MRAPTSRRAALRGVVLPALALLPLTAACSDGGTPGGTTAARTVTTTEVVPTPVRVTVTPEGTWSAATPTTSAPTPIPAAPTAPTTTSQAAPRTAPRTTVRTTIRTTAVRTATARTTARPTARPTAARSGTAGGVLVPAFRGESLAAAYIRLGDLGVSRSHRSSQDVSGEGRTVLQPNNWQVCTQRPAAGSRASAQTVYQFGVVKFGERCP